MVEIEHRRLRPALELASAIAARRQKSRPPEPFPSEFRRFTSAARLPKASLGRLRRVLDADADFRSVVAGAPDADELDEVARLWLRRPDGWEQRIDELLAAESQDAHDDELRRALRREEKRRDAAESARDRLQERLDAEQARVQRRDERIERLVDEAAGRDERVGELEAELRDLRVELRHERDRVGAARARLRAAQEELSARGDDARAGEAPGDDVQDGRLDARVVSEISEAATTARELAERLAAVLAERPAPSRQDGSRTGGRSGPRRRTPIPLPGGVLASSRVAADHLVRSGAAVLVDGYNVAMLAWPDRSLEQQREALLDRIENLVRRHGTDVTVVFDGASVTGAHTARRRFVRVVYSPEGVIADDVLREEVRRLPCDRGVVVVTDDREIVNDVRRDGANTLPSNALIAVL